MLAVARKAVRYHDSDEEDEDAMMYDEIDPTAWDLPQVMEWLINITSKGNVVHYLKCEAF